MKNKIVLIFISFGLIGFFVSGCAKKVPPLEDIQNAKIALVKAEESNASKFSSESFELAKKHYKEIKVYMDKNDFDAAKYSAQKALIGAKLSQSRAENAKVQEKVDKLNSEVSILKKEFTTISQ